MSKGFQAKSIGSLACGIRLCWAGESAPIGFYPPSCILVECMGVNLSMGAPKLRFQRNLWGQIDRRYVDNHGVV